MTCYVIRSTIAAVSNRDTERVPALSSRGVSIKRLDRSDWHVATGLAGVRYTRAVLPRQKKQFCAMTSGCWSRAKDGSRPAQSGNAAGFAWASRTPILFASTVVPTRRRHHAARDDG